MKVSDLSPKSPTSKQISRLGNNNNSANQIRIPSPMAYRKINTSIPKLPITSPLCSSSPNYTNCSLSNGASFSSRDTQSSSRTLNNDDEKIQVYLRVRPPLPNEKTYDYEIDSETITIYPKNLNLSSYYQDKSFTFKKVLNAETTQAEVFETVAVPLLSNFLEGDDVLIFCYGSTNAGKTFTVSGTRQNPGLLSRSLNYIVSFLSSENMSTNPNSTPETKKAKPFQLYASFIEIYNEKIYDLLNITKNAESLKLGVNQEGETEVKGAVEIPFDTLDDVKALIQKAESGRHRGFTELNCESSRSHTVFQIKLKKKKTSCSFSIVDLAGSERLSSINSTMGSFKEACNINKSMLVLGKCIRYLKKHNVSPTKCRQIPYRESKLTHILKHFFEPTLRPSKAAMIINVSPASIQIEDTIFAMQFAASAMLCQIRHVEREENDFEYDELEDDFDTAKESYEEIEARIENQLREEMDKYLEKVKQDFDEHAKTVETINSQILARRQNIKNNYLLKMKQKQQEMLEYEERLKKKREQPKKIKKVKKIIRKPRKSNGLSSEILANQDKIDQLQRILKDLLKQNSDIEKQNQSIVGQIQDTSEKLKNQEMIIQNLQKDNNVMKMTISHLESKCDEVNQTILYETQSVEVVEFKEYPVPCMFNFPPKFTFDWTEKNDIQSNEIQTTHSTPEKSSDPIKFHSVIRVKIPPPK